MLSCVQTQSAEYIPVMAKVEKCPAYRDLYCYDPETDSWTICPAYPSWIQNASGAWLNGKLYVKGTAVETDESGSIPYYPVYAEEPYPVYVYSYTPGDASWVECSSEGAADEYTLFTDGSKLMLAGFTEDDWDVYYDDYHENGFPCVRDYDPEAGAGKPWGHSKCSEKNPKATCAGGYIYLAADIVTPQSHCDPNSYQSPGGCQSACSHQSPSSH